jgi:methionyl-tRNA formyltransferase
LSKEEGKISWSSSADEIKRKINAFNPSPGAWSSFRGQVIKINRVISSSEKVPAGALLLANKSIYIGTSTQALELIEVTPAGKAAMPATSWANGARITSDDVML